MCGLEYSIRYRTEETFWCYILPHSSGGRISIWLCCHQGLAVHTKTLATCRQILYYIWLRGKTYCSLSLELTTLDSHTLTAFLNVVFLLFLNGCQILITKDDKENSTSTFPKYVVTQYIIEYARTQTIFGKEKSKVRFWSPKFLVSSVSRHDHILAR